MQHRPAPALPVDERGEEAAPPGTKPRPARRGTPAPHEILNVRYAKRGSTSTIKRPSSLAGYEAGVPVSGKAVQRVVQWGDAAPEHAGRPDPPFDADVGHVTGHLRHVDEEDDGL